MRFLPPALVALAAALALTACGNAGGGGAAPTTGPVYYGVSGPVTGPNAEYGRLWKQGFDLALTKINAAGGINGRPVALKWEDSQSDPKQTVPIAQKFVDDREVIAELGDFSSPASMAASSVYQDAGLVQFGFTNSHPDFTKGVIQRAGKVDAVNVGADVAGDRADGQFGALSSDSHQGSPF
jgi:branched-chain amino acid transport system substrate-binding protein